MEAIKKEQEEEEVRECTFRPKINHKSAKLIQDRQAILRVRFPRLRMWKRAKVSICMHSQVGDKHHAWEWMFAGHQLCPPALVH